MPQRRKEPCVPGSHSDSVSQRFSSLLGPILEVRETCINCLDEFGSPEIRVAFAPCSWIYGVTGITNCRVSGSTDENSAVFRPPVVNDAPFEKCRFSTTEHVDLTGYNLNLKQRNRTKLLLTSRLNAELSECVFV